MSRKGLLAAVRGRMRTQALAREAEEATPAPRRRPTDPPHDAELKQLEAEARYHRDRFNLYHARVISGSSVATSATRNGLCTFTVSPDCPGEDVIAVTSGYAQVAHMAGIGTSRGTFRCLSLV